GDVISTDLGWSGAGGFAGDNHGVVENCYARGDVTGLSDDVGGFIGYNNGPVDRVYSTGLVTGVGALVGGLIGENDGVVDNSFWDTDTSGMLVSAGGTGKTTAEMKDSATFIGAGWDFATIWDITPSCNNDYPCLLNVTPDCGIPVIPFVVNKAYALARCEL
ncbi:unnamed protein product, partial [marine sediment metagenome]